MTSDSWVLVQNVSELKPGMVVKLVPCKACNEIHQYMLLNPVQGWIDTGDVVWGWNVAPLTCEGLEGGDFNGSVKARRVYRLETGESDAAQQEQWREWVAEINAPAKVGV